MSLKIVVLAKQVPDTRNVGKDAMTAEGTVNRQALPAIFNPEDLNALEMALTIKDQIKDTHITIVTMGPDRAAEIVRDAMFRGADDGIVVSDRKLAGSDTLATSYAIAQAIKKLGHVDIVFGGRQAIDGDTAQVGPQTAEKLNIPQITYAEEIENITDKDITIKRRLERGVEVVKANYPVLITVHSSAKNARFYNAKRLMAYKNAEVTIWSAADIDAEDDRLGLSGSPTKVKKIDSVVLTHKDNITIEPTDDKIDGLVKELINAHIIG
jgi:electron transfer flavoprotein beta subunit